MSKSDDFIAFISTFKDASPTISDEQRKGFLRLAVEKYGLTFDEATSIFDASGIVIGEIDNLLEIFGLTVTEIKRYNQSEIVNRVESIHKKLYNESLMSGGRPRQDGRSEEQWRRILNQARDTLTDSKKRNEYLSSLQYKEPFNEINSGATSLEDMSFIPEGEFEMGSNDEEAFDDENPVHTVFLNEFYIDQYPVTNAQYKVFLDANPHWNKHEMPKKYGDVDYLKHWRWDTFPKGEAEFPVSNVSWYAAMAYAQWKGKRLPTEAEWEKAARGGLVGYNYPHGNSIDATSANFDWNIGKTTPIGKYPANGYGLYDMCGNVWEWCLDKYEKSFYKNSPDRNPIASEQTIDSLNHNFLEIDSNRVLRGGSWRIPASLIRTAKRNAEAPWFSLNVIGFRCVYQDLHKDKSLISPSDGSLISHYSKLDYAKT
ncbi:SUMF1/EgtB/PvdO family nonheme iron enzyme [Candidatus Poribacteria bacterium]|nr:SUMF1/EgtB/PvdO family nonheme iron enzyme [Candidatus Poribacteria bacterium]